MALGPYPFGIQYLSHVQPAMFLLVSPWPIYYNFNRKNFVIWIIKEKNKDRVSKKDLVPQGRRWPREKTASTKEKEGKEG